MKTTEHFKIEIQTYLEQRALYDDLFAINYHNPDKNVDDCLTYILNCIQRSGCSGFADDEIFGIAIHYYDEADIEVGQPIDCRVVINHHIELTEEEKQQARQQAMQQAQAEAYANYTKRAKPTTTTATNVQQKSLF